MADQTRPVSSLRRRSIHSCISRYQHHHAYRRREIRRHSLATTLPGVRIPEDGSPSAGLRLAVHMRRTHIPDICRTGLIICVVPYHNESYVIKKITEL